MGKKTSNLVITGILVACFILVVASAIMIFSNQNESTGIDGQSENQVASQSEEEKTEKPDTTVQDTEVEDVAGVFDAQDFMNTINVGWNLGNSLDSCVSGEFRNVDGSYTPDYYETAWGNPTVTKELIDYVAESGINTIRIPVTWYYNTYEDENGTLKVQDAWIERVKQVVDYAIDDQLYVILDSHHDGEMIWADSDDMDKSKKNAEELWTQIAEYFKEYDEHLLFESYNELNDKETSWTYSDASAQAANELNQIFVDTVRKSGGNNENRVLIVGTFLNGYAEEIQNSFTLPTDVTDGLLIVDVHAYCSEFNQDIEDDFDTIEAFSKKVGAPIIVGEFGTTADYTPADYRTIQAGNYVARAADHGIKCYWWDDGGTTSYSIIDRNDLSKSNTEILDSLVNPQEYTTEYLSENTYSEAGQFEYTSVDTSNGELKSDDKNGIVLVADGDGMSVTPGNTYDLKLTTVNDGDGMRIYAVAYYDKSGNFLRADSVDSAMNYSFTAPENAAYVKVGIYNPWGTRLWLQYKTFFKSGDLYLDVKEY